MVKLGGLIDACPVGNNMYRLPCGQIVDSKTYLALEQKASYDKSAKEIKDAQVKFKLEIRVIKEKLKKYAKRLHEIKSDLNF